MTEPKHNIVPQLEHLAVPLDSLHSLAGNPRRGDVEAVMASYRRFGQRKPITAKLDGEVTAGNHQLEAARRLGWTHIACVQLDDDDATAKAWALTDNHTAELGENDDELLASMLAEVAADPDLLAATSYTQVDLDGLLGTLHQPTGLERGEAEVRELDPVWGVIVQCNDERQQVDLLARLTEEGFTVKALIS
jgi:ParB-like chromosome segregation protein Spo0J